MLPAPPVPAQTNDSLSAEEGLSVVDKESTSDRGGGGGEWMKLDDDLGYLDDLDVMRDYGVDAFLVERLQASVSGGASDGTAETTSSSEGGTVDAPLAPVGRADSDGINYGPRERSGSTRGPVEEGGARA